MKGKTVILMTLAVIIATLLFGNMAHALTTRQVIHVRVYVVGLLSLNLEDEWLDRNFHDPKAEAFSELTEHGVYVDKLQKDNSTLWLFTKTE